MIEIADKRVNLGGVHLENRIIAVIKEWAKHFPHELVAFDRQMKILRSGLYRSNAISRGGGLLHKAEIPVTLNKFLIKGVDPDWLVKPDIRRLVLRNFQVGLINKTSEMNK